MQYSTPSIGITKALLNLPKFNPNRDSELEQVNPLVLVIDTNMNMNWKSSKEFIHKALGVSNSLDLPETIIIYTAGKKIDGIDRVKKGENPDFSKIVPHEGVIDRSYSLAFDCMQKNNIEPLFVLYLTLGLWDCPSKDEYGISKFDDRILLAIPSPTKEGNWMGGSINLKPMPLS
jgi:hypothetical protein